MLKTIFGLRVNEADNNRDDDAVNRLICAAVVDKKFCQLLLRDPALAIASGYRGESFDLSEEDRLSIQSIQASSLSDFAHQLFQQINGRNLS